MGCIFSEGVFLLSRTFVFIRVFMIFSLYRGMNVSRVQMQINVIAPSENILGAWAHKDFRIRECHLFSAVNKVG